MMILINTDNNIQASEDTLEILKGNLAKSLDRYDEYLTRLEVKFSDVNAAKSGENDKKCVIEARPKGLQPIVVTSFGNSIENAMSEGVNKMRASLDTAIGKMRNH